MTKQKIINYYDLCHKDFRLIWDLDKTMGMHFGYWDQTTRSLPQALQKINGVMVYSSKRAPDTIKRRRANIGIIAVPKEESQEVADLMVLSGLRGIINFSPMTIVVPKNVFVKDIDFTIEFLSLFCGIQM